MRRPLLALAVLAGCLAASTQAASTAGNTVPGSTAVYRETAVSGASLTSISYTVSAGTITAATPRLRGVLLGRTVSARFGAGPAVTCTPGVLTVISLITGVREGTYTCPGLGESASRPRKLQITVS